MLKSMRNSKNRYFYHIFVSPGDAPGAITLNGLAVWLSGNALASINVVTLRQTRLVLGWVTVCGRVNHFGM